MSLQCKLKIYVRSFLCVSAFSLNKPLKKKITEEFRKAAIVYVVVHCCVIAVNNNCISLDFALSELFLFLCRALLLRILKLTKYIAH